MEITTKQRSTLRAFANTLEPLVNIGKSGLTPTVISEVRLCLYNKELVKINILKNSAVKAKEIAEQLRAATQSSIVQVIGGKIVLYKYSDKEDIEHINF